jgi:hypothetical protein
MEDCTVVVSSSQGEKLKVEKEIGKGWEQEKGRMRMSGRQRS